MNSKGTVCNDMRMLTKWSVASKSFGEQTTAVGHQACSMPGGSPTVVGDLLCARH